MPSRPLCAVALAGLLAAAACSSDDPPAAVGTEPLPTDTAPATEADDAGGDEAADDTGGEPGDDADGRADESDAEAIDLGPIAAPVRHPAVARPIYFVMPDRFANGDPGNDTGSIDAAGPEGALVHGFDPTRKGYHHGGDLAGLTERLDYIASLGAGAIWITPPFTNRFVQGDGTLDGSSSSYHGYWQIDWERIDPHLGSEEEMQAFIAAAHERDLHVYFDIVINHTGDVIRYEGDSYVYWSTAARPYRDADGNVFEVADVVGLPPEEFPELDPATSFAYVPTFADPADATAKAPAWLNDVTLYHNRGDSTFSGESDTFGDFFGLDDLFTEHPRVVEGMVELYSDIIERYPVDGFRIDTMKHVNPEFWAEFAPAIRARAAELGRPEFFMFGEVFSTDPILQSSFTNLGVSATLDFIVNDAVKRYAGGGIGRDLVDELDDDDWFTDLDNNASMQVTSVGNHDEGRLGYFLERAEPGADEARLLERAQLAYDLLFLLRGVPVVYYGDEQGFTGDGGDQLARQDMFPTQTPEYLDDDNIGSDVTPAADNFDPGHPLYRHIAQLAALRRDHPTLVTGAQVNHATEGPVVAFSRIDRDELVEYVVVSNSDGAQSVPVRFPVLTPDTSFTTLYADGEVDVASTDAPVLAADAAGEVTVEVPPLATYVWRAERTLADDLAAAEPTIRIVRPEDGGEIPTNRYRIEAEVEGVPYAEVTFAAAVDHPDFAAAEPFVIGVDDAQPYRVYWNTIDVPTGATVEVIATVAAGERRAVDRVVVTMGDRS